jgi:hypothetical protein
MEHFLSIIFFDSWLRNPRRPLSALDAAERRLPARDPDARERRTSRIARGLGPYP